MVYHDKESLLEQLKKDPENLSFLSVYKDYIEVLDKEGLIELYSECDLDIYDSIFKTLISMSRAKKLTPDEIITKQTEYLKRKIKAASEATSFSKEDIAPLVEDLVNNAKDAYNTVIRNKVSSNNNISAYNLSLCSELNMKVLYMLDNIDDAIKDARKRILQGAKKELLARRIYEETKSKMGTINDSVNDGATIEDREILDTIKSFAGRKDVKVNGHNLYAILRNLSKKDLILIHHLLITVTSKDYFREGRLPNEGEIIDGKDYLLLAHNFNPEEVLKNANMETLAHSNDNIESRYLETIIKLDDNYHLAFATATSIVLDYRLKDINKELKDDNHIYTDEEKEELTYLDEETKEFIKFLKNNIVDSNLINIGDKKLLDNIKNYVNDLKNIKDYSDIEKLSDCFQEWVNSIDLRELTEEEFEQLEKLDPKFLYDRLPLASKVLYRRREAEKNISTIMFSEDLDTKDPIAIKTNDSTVTFSDILDADSFGFDLYVLKTHNITEELYDLVKNYIDNSTRPKSIVNYHNRESNKDFYAELKNVSAKNCAFIKSLADKIDAIIKSKPDDMEEVQKTINFIVNRYEYLNRVIESASDEELDDFFNILHGIEINENMQPLTEIEAFANYKLLNENCCNPYFSNELIMYSEVENTIKIIDKCREEHKDFYPELIIYPQCRTFLTDTKEKDNMFNSFYERIKDFKNRKFDDALFYPIGLSPSIIEKFFFDQEEYNRFIEEIEDTREKQIQHDLEFQIMKYIDSGGDINNIHGYIDNILEKMNLINLEDGVIKK